MSKLLDPVDIVADAIMKQPGTIPSKATVIRAHWAIDNLREAGWVLVPRLQLEDMHDVIDAEDYPISSAMMAEWLGES